MVVEVDVREHGDRGSSRSIDRSASSPSVTSHPSPGARVAAELRHLGAEDEGRVAAELLQAVGDHRRRRRLPVRAPDDDRRPRRDDLGQELAAVQHTRGGRDLGIVERHRGRVDDLGAGRHVLGPLLPDRDVDARVREQRA